MRIGGGGTNGGAARWRRFAIRDTWLFVLHLCVCFWCTSDMTFPADINFQALCFTFSNAGEMDHVGMICTVCRLRVFIAVHTRSGCLRAIKASKLQWKFPAADGSCLRRGPPRVSTSWKKKPRRVRGLNSISRKKKGVTTVILTKT